ncbi:MAG: hypothetical protein COZ06_24300 [Armatimonadetes bacterium CG_4_10_14_3_um_filter_66_18]|nr:hypothetical protein [Armatimonadota bacterium]OIP03449.1 MAG: hypothetical protein AUJ96_14550 [Armatimonadetes bacterium CG2_30_66_41]PIU93029.1 MAG: hypothetical protein COS65_14875 [Armatimonadetes bacterium CG06_land_8_20_14_3_00_66_21]PIX40826.1 MAG: hypothetical protein COZ57_24955 [Armatimonadetes bacterium CG_4_8_14_3_um_filter_66_20]PIY42841.1 MAG: hypothetical protein COZ06_24300 [Armatimonadetes bacterium CG_4_10_14_3_um_filter_66_18]PIZ48163.1 MAG: hypothetical protein COY42_07
MVRVEIDERKVDLREASESWIRQQILARREDGQPVCVRVCIETGGVNITLSTGSCPERPGARREATLQERRFFELWNCAGLGEREFNVEELLSFLRPLL